MLYFNHRVREDIIKTFNRLAYVGGFGELGAAAAQAYLHGHYVGFGVAVAYVILCMIPAWLVMASVPDHKED